MAKHISLKNYLEYTVFLTTDRWARCAHDQPNMWVATRWNSMTSQCSPHFTVQGRNYNRTLLNLSHTHTIDSKSGGVCSGGMWSEILLWLGHIWKWWPISSFDGKVRRKLLRHRVSTFRHIHAAHDVQNRKQQLTCALPYLSITHRSTTRTYLSLAMTK